MFSRLFGSKNKETAASVPADFSFLQTDMHSHYIPGIDDGAQTIEDSLAMVRAMQEMGYKSLVTTPHVNFDYYPNTPETIGDGLKVLQNALATEGINMPVRAAAEYYIDDYFMQLLNDRKPLLPVYDNYVLVEISFMYAPVNINEILFKIQTSGYRPILAHPERYGYYHGQKDIYQELKDRGCLLQLNALSLTGYYGGPIKEAAEYMLKQKLYDYCGSDMHHERHVAGMRKLAQSKMMDILGAYHFHNSKITF
jgi:protein-tyrosine phosphatase